MQNLLIISNLYPLPWEPNRATFNKQQFNLLKEKMNVHILVPVAWPEYFKNLNNLTKSESVTYFPYFYTPKFGRQHYSKMMEWSLMTFTRNAIKEFKPDAILSSWAFPEGVAGEKIARKMNIPFFLKVHGTDINGHGQIPSRAKQITQAANKSNGIIAVSQALKNTMIEMGIEKDKINVIYNGVNKEKFNYDRNVKRDKTILFVGNLKKEKGVMELMESFYNLSLEEEIKLQIAGNGPMLNEMKKYAKSHLIDKKVEFLGTVDHEKLPTLMKKAHCLALPSYSEGVPNVVLEAMSCGTPVVSTMVGGIPEVVKTGTTGYLVNPQSSKELTGGLKLTVGKDWNHSNIAKYAMQYNWPSNIKKISNLISFN